MVVHVPSGWGTTSVNGCVLGLTLTGWLHLTVSAGVLKLRAGKSCVNVTAVDGVAVKAPESFGLGKKLPETELIEMGGSAAATTPGLANSKVATATRPTSPRCTAVLPQVDVRVSKLGISC